MKKMTREELLAAFEVLADMDVTSAAFRASERIRQHLVAVEAEAAQARDDGLVEAVALLGDLARSSLSDERCKAMVQAATAVSGLRDLTSRPGREPEPGAADCCPEVTGEADQPLPCGPVEMASEENGLLSPRRCTSKRCVTYEGRTFHALGCKLSESFESDPDEKVEP